MHRQKPAPVTPAPFKPWLATVHGRRLAHGDEAIAPADAPEAVLEIEFEGLTEDEQRAVLDSFPGGRRFRLAGSHH